jgi:GNAT superfamily N-acetyltransferase
MSMALVEMSGRERLDATTSVLQRARCRDALHGMWEAADVQWWWRRPRPSDEFKLPVWFDGEEPVATVGLTDWGESLQVDAFADPTSIDVGETWHAAMEHASELHDGPCETLVHDDDDIVRGLVAGSGFEPTDELSGTCWMPASRRRSVERVEGFTVTDRRVGGSGPHPMIARNGPLVGERLRECSLYDPSLDLAVVDLDGVTAGYALFWFDPVTLVGLLEPMRIEDPYQRRGLARVLISEGLERLAQCGAQRLKVGFTTEPARRLYLGAGFEQTSVDRRWVRPAPAS